MGRLRAAPVLARSRASAEDGLTLIELMIAIFILSVAVLGMAGVAAQSLTSLRLTRDREQATDAASAAIEQVRLEEFDTIALDAGDPAVTAIGSCYAPTNEPVVTTPIAANAIPHVRVVDGTFTVRVFVMWADDDGTGDCATSPGTHSRTTKRIIAEASWVDGGVTREVTESTLVGEAERGLPLPDFTVLPPAAEMLVSDAEASPPSGADPVEKCLPHGVRNLGATDSYDVEIIDFGQDFASTADDTVLKPTAPATVPRSRFLSAGPASFGVWSIRAWFEYPSTGSAFDPKGAPTGLADNPQLMRDANNDDRPESTRRVETGDTGRLWVCYTADKLNKPSVGNIYRFKVVVHSRFDGNRTEEVVHTLERTNKPPVALFLFQDPALDSGPQARNLITLKTTGGTTTITGGIKEMGPLGGSYALGANLFDWDTNITPLAKGATLQKGVANTYLIFHESFAVDTTFRPAGELILWTASTAGANTASPAIPTPETVELAFSLEVVDKENQLSGDVLWSASASYVHSTAGFTELKIPINMVTDREIDDKDYLRLRVNCRATSQSHCHVAYDAVNYESRLLLVPR